MGRNTTSSTPTVNMKALAEAAVLKQSQLKPGTGTSPQAKDAPAKPPRSGIPAKPPRSGIPAKPPRSPQIKPPAKPKRSQVTHNALDDALKQPPTPTRGRTHVVGPLDRPMHILSQFKALPDQEKFLAEVNRVYSCSNIDDNLYTKLKFIAATFSQLKNPDLDGSSKSFFLAEIYKLLTEVTKNQGIRSELKSYLNVIYTDIIELLTKKYGGIDKIQPSIDLIFSRQVSAFGLIKDATQADVFGMRHSDERENSLLYLTPAQAETFRVNFISGRACQHPYWLNSSSDSINPKQFNYQELLKQTISKDNWVPLSSANSPTINIPQDKLTPVDAYASLSASKEGRWSSVVMDKNWILYSAPHASFSNNQRSVPFVKSMGKQAFYHSSYLRKANLDFSGAWLVEDGIIKGICNNSGHYKSESHSLFILSEALKSYGVELSIIDVFKVEIDDNNEAAPVFFTTADQLRSKMSSFKLSDIPEKEQAWRKSQESEFARALEEKSTSLDYFIHHIENLEAYTDPSEWGKVDKKRKKKK
ncbi:hypothetical protein [Pelagibaculum spongiae]|nr:hypothetical protein [Pelagibaculum spongiae]